MKILKENIKLIIAFLIGVIISGTVFAYSYYSDDIGYIKQGTTNEITVSDALDDLYSKVPSGSTTIELTGSFDVSQFATAVVQNLYTTTQYNNNYTTGYNEGNTAGYNSGLAASKGKTYNYGEGTVTSSREFKFNIGFTEPSYIIVAVLNSNVGSAIHHVSLYIRNSNGTYTQYHAGGSNANQSLVTGTEFKFTAANSEWAGKAFKWIAVK